MSDYRYVHSLCTGLYSRGHGTVVLCCRGKYDPRVKNGKLDMTENWGLTIMPQHFGEEGVVEARPRQAARLAARLAKSQPGDF